MTRKKYEDILYIDENGIALDCYGNEQRDPDGLVIIIPKYLRKFFKLIERA